MHREPTAVKRALISVSNKDGIIDLARGLHELGAEIISTGGTAKKIAAANVPVKDISAFTGFPEIMAGRVKTLQPKIHGGILGRRDAHAKTAQKYGIEWIDLVVCNLYPFSKTIKKTSVPFDEIMDNIDIGGPTMIRSAAKNMGWVTVVTDPADYAPLLEELKCGRISFDTRQRLAVKAFGHTAQYDTVIHQYFTMGKSRLLSPAEGQHSNWPAGNENFPNILNLTFAKLYDLRYGENPHQKAAAYQNPYDKGDNILNAKIIQGKQLSYNNINDADGALACLKEFDEPSCVVVKHANPCGVASGKNITEVFKRAYNADPLSAFGGIIALNRPCPTAIAEELTKVFVEIIIAPDFAPEALEIFVKKPKVRVLQLPLPPTNTAPAIRYEFRHITGGLLVQDYDTQRITRDRLQFVTNKKPTEQEISNMVFGWQVLKHVKSNAILTAKEHATLSIGPGQVSRVDAVEIALRKNGDKLAGAILASDGFFPFRDSIDKIARTGITAIIQPGGSIKDQAVIAACNEHGISMIFTGVRCFKH